MVWDRGKGKKKGKRKERGRLSVLTHQSTDQVGLENAAASLEILYLWVQ